MLLYNCYYCFFVRLLAPCSGDRYRLPQFVLPAAMPDVSCFFTIFMVVDEAAEASDLLLMSGCVDLQGPELAEMLAEGQMRVVPPGPPLSSLWPRVWALSNAEDEEVSDGSEVWWLASQCGAEELSAAPTYEIADEALDEWLKWFARGA